MFDVYKFLSTPSLATYVHLFRVPNSGKVLLARAFHQYFPFTHPAVSFSYYCACAQHHSPFFFTSTQGTQQLEIPSPTNGGPRVARGRQQQQQRRRTRGGAEVYDAAHVPGAPRLACLLAADGSIGGLEEGAGSCPG